MCVQGRALAADTEQLQRQLAEARAAAGSGINPKPGGTAPQPPQPENGRRMHPAAAEAVEAEAADPLTLNPMPPLRDSTAGVAPHA